MSCGPGECIKVIIVGNCGVGKTCLLHRFVRFDFMDRYTQTIGAEFLEKDVFCCDSEIAVKLMLWDTAGQETSDALTHAYYSGAGVAVLAFSTVDHDSYIDMVKWKEKVEFACGPIVMVLCQTKCDLFRESLVTDREAVELAEEFQLPLFRVSSKDNFNVCELFEFIAQQCLVAEEVERPDLSKQLQALDVKRGNAVNRVKKIEYKLNPSPRDSPDSRTTAGKVLTTVAITTDEHASSAAATDFLCVKTPTSQRKGKPRNRSLEKLKSASSSVPKRSRKCECTLM